MVYEKSEITTIKLRKETKQKLNRLGFKGESYDQILERAIFGRETPK